MGTNQGGRDPDMLRGQSESLFGGSEVFRLEWARGRATEGMLGEVFVDLKSYNLDCTLYGTGRTHKTVLREHISEHVISKSQDLHGLSLTASTRLPFLNFSKLSLQFLLIL